MSHKFDSETFSKEWLVENEKELEKVAQEILDEVLKIDWPTATILALKGELGSGKTTFTKNLAKILQIKESITSPTFVIQKSFDILKSENSTDQTHSEIFEKYQKLIHIDSYRLDLSGELLHLGWSDLLSNPRNLIVVEWPERVSDILPEKYFLISFEHVNETTRKISANII